MDHADFFTRAYGVLTTVFNSDLICYHAKTPFNKHYMKYRHDYEGDFQHISEKYT